MLKASLCREHTTRAASAGKCPFAGGGEDRAATGRSRWDYVFFVWLGGSEAQGHDGVTQLQN